LILPLDSLVDSARYPIGGTGPAAYETVVARGRAALAAEGFCALPRFVHPATLARMVQEAVSAIPHGYRRDQQLTAYDSDTLVGLPAGHTARRTHPYRMRVIAQDRLPEDGAILSLYREAALSAFIADLLQEPALHCCADPLVSCTVTVLDPGDEHGWHFDSNDFVASLLLQPAASGGSFEFAPALRSEEDENYDAVESVFDGDRSFLRTPAVDAGTLMLFRGKYALHRVSPVAGDRPRLIALLSFDRRPDMVFPVDTRLAAVGRAH